MVDYKQDLWPDEIKSIELISPVTIIKEQGKILGKKTNNIVVGQVFSLNSYPSLYEFGYRFSLVSSSMNYQYQLFSFYFRIDNYPVFVEVDDSIKTEKFKDLSNGLIEAKSEEELMTILKEIFSATKTLKIIHGLLAQSQDIKDES